MNVFNWLTDRFSNRGKALAFFKRGMTRARKHDRQGAIEDYSATIGQPGASPSLKAKALYNRALVYAAVGEGSKATADLNLVLSTTEALTSVKTEARRTLVRMQRRLDKSNV
jgi:hypothetical protein